MIGAQHAESLWSCDESKLVYIWIGKDLPGWAIHAIELSSRYCGIGVGLIASRSVTKKFPMIKTYCLEDFYQRDIEFENLFLEKNRAFRDGFWLKTLERFLVLEAFVEKYKINKIFHAELDNLIFDISTLNPILDSIGKGFFCPRDSTKRGIGSLIYLNDMSTLKHMNRWFRNHHGSIQNDMDLLGEMLTHEPGFYSLPTETALGEIGIAEWTYIDKEKTKGIFDAAAMGQYLFGIDPRNTNKVLRNGFTNENILIDFGRLEFRFDNKRQSLFVRYGNEIQWKRCYNLHIHSKIFSKLSSSAWFMQVLEKSNHGKRSLITLNVAHWKLFGIISQIWAKISCLLGNY